MKNGNNPEDLKAFEPRRLRSPPKRSGVCRIPRGGMESGGKFRRQTGVTRVKNRGVLIGVLLLAGMILVSVALRADAQSRDEKAIQALFQRFDVALKAKDVNTIMTLYAPNVRVFDAGVPRQYKGAKAYRSVYEGLFATFPGPIETRVSDVASTVVGTMALTTNIETWVLTDKDRNRFTLTFRVTDVWRKINGKWLIIHEHTSLPVDYATGKADLLSKP